MRYGTEDLTGCRIGNFLVLRYIPVHERQNKKNGQWLIRCSFCQKELEFSKSKMLRQKSCGCLLGEKRDKLTGRKPGPTKCSQCSQLGHRKATCGLAPDNLSRKERNNYLSRLWQKQNREQANCRQRRWRHNNPDRVKQLAIEQNQNLRLKAINAYDGKCACCGFADQNFKLHGKSFLNIDHINGHGRKFNKEHNVQNIYQWLKNCNYPPGFRVLCRGCNNSMEPNQNFCLLHRKRE